MKKVLVLLTVLMLFSFALAADGWYSDFILINGEVGPDNYYWIGGDPGYGTQFNGHDFGTVSSLTINGCDLRYWTEAQDRVGGAFYWRIDTGTATEVIWTQAALGGNDYQGTLSGLNINVLEGLTPGQSYELQIWAKSWGTYDMWLNNSGSNYVATFTIASEPDPSAITLAAFVAKVKDGAVELAWTTASEVENSHFIVYRDGVAIGQVKASGTCSDPHDYLFIDASVEPGMHAYALADVEFSGNEVLHDALSVTVGADLAATDFRLAKAYPNPFNPDVTLDYYMANKAPVDLGVYNMQGEKVANLVNDLREVGLHHATWNASGFPSGIYFVRMIAAGNVQTQKVVLMK